MPKFLTYKPYTITTAGGAVTFDVSDVIEEYDLIPDSGTVDLTVNLTVDPTGAPTENMQYVFNYGGGVNYDPATVTIFGRLLTAEEALSKFKIICTYIDATWVVELIYSDLSSINGSVLTDGTVTNAKLAGSIALSKLLTATRNFFMRAGVGGVWEAVTGGASGNLIQSNGTDIVSNAMSGAITIDGTGVTTLASNAVTTAKIADANVTVAKLETALKTEVINIQASFETGEVGAFEYRMPFAGSVTNVYINVVKALSATDDGAITLKDDAGTNMTITTPIDIPLSTARGTSYDSAVTANNTFVAGDIITVFSAKTTAGGKVVGSLTLLRS